MEIYKHRKGFQTELHWLLALIVLVLIVFGVLAILQTVSLFLVTQLFDIPMESMMNLFGGNLDHPNARLALLVIQGLGGGTAFLLGGWVFMHFVDKKTMVWPKQLERTNLNGLLILLPLLLGFILFNSLFVYLNMNVQFPDFLAELEKAMRDKEDELMKLTIYITNFENTLELIVGVLVIGVIAGIGEEYLFRGILQPKLRDYTRSIHWGIWLSAFIFSAIHFQFYGFIPRMLLGALFGYLYVYSGSLVYPMLAHILNNTFTVIMVHLNKQGVVEFNLEEPGQLYWHYILIGLVLFVVSAFYFVLLHRRRSPENG
ncbi:CPBP family intramembrane glutamic endopeptidase [Pleomorphovibrio marinus]|uniref:CPBP family intramembrane glutamic endopeptidase n=1 Tax=Pleomorphovibrio marinus TaxID=2164132 RepID=UPI000E0AC249|nr:CPBP family intramembrane glutamic endopeptidase [Pleomorphovibrio marinus]